MATIFLEKENQSYEMDIRLFVEGVEVTDWVAENIGVTLSGTGGMNQLTFTLANPEDIWVVTPQNLDGTWRKGGLYGEDGKRAIYSVKKAREEEAAKSIKALGGEKTTLLDAGVYNLGPEQLIFHKHDCVRLFVRNPVAREEQWMFGFTGFIDTHPFQDDYVMGSVPLNFSCYDIKGLMKRMRVALQPMPCAGLDSKGVAQAAKDAAPLLRKEGILGPEAGMFEDLMDTRGFNHVLAGKNFEQVMNFLFLGAGGIMGGDVGAGKFAVSLFGGQVKANIPLNTETATAPQKLSTKEQEVIDEFNKLNQQTLAIKIGGYATTGAHRDPGTYDQFTALLASDKDKAELRKLDTRAKVLAETLKQAQDANKRNRQVKKAEGQPQETDSPISTVSTAPAFAFKRGHVGRMMKGWKYEYPGCDLEEWHNLLLTVNKQGRYLTPKQVTLLGKGTVLENVLGSPYNAQLHMLLPASGIDAKTFAQVDFQTQDFQSGLSFMTRYELVEHVCEQIDYQWFVTPAGDVAMEFPMYDFTPRIYGRYKTTLTVEKHAISASVEDEAADIPTALVVTAQESQAGTGSDQMARPVDPNRTIVYAPLLAARLGATVEEISSPVAIGGAVTGGSDIGGGGIKGAEAWALLQMQKRLGQSSTLALPIPYRPWLLPNRPLLHIPRQRIGIIHQVQHSISIGAACQTTPVMNYVKKKHSDGKFRYPTSGGENMPINYATMFSSAGDVQRSGIVIRKGVTHGTSEGVEAGPKVGGTEGSNSPKINSETHTVLDPKLRGIDPKLGELRPPFQAIIAQILQNLRAKGWQARIHNAYRNAAQQLEKVRLGYAKNANPGTHNWGLACDIIDRRYAWNIGKVKEGEAPPAAKFWLDLWAECRKFGITCGAAWFGTAAKPHKSVWNKWGVGWDPAHCELPWRQIKQEWKHEYLGQGSAASPRSKQRPRDPGRAGGE